MRGCITNPIRKSVVTIFYITSIAQEYILGVTPASSIFWNRGAKTLLDVGDPNLAAGMYFGSMKNGPKSYGILLVLGSGAAYYTGQFFIGWNDAANSTSVHARVYRQGAWENWISL